MGTWSPSATATRGNDTFFGNSSDEDAQGREGNDVLYGAGGNDGLYGDAGNDSLYGGDGADFILDYDGNDLIYGGDGDDHINDRDDNAPFGETTRIYGGAGYDLITVTSSVQSGTIDGGDDFDTLQFAASINGPTIDFRNFSLSSIERLNGSVAFIGSIATFEDFTYLRYSGSDADLGKQMTISLTNSGSINLLDELGTQSVFLTTYGSGNNDVMLAGGNDHLVGGSGNDSLDASAGDDLIDGGAGADSLYGFIGNDTIYGGKDGDYVDAGAGDDVIVDVDGDDALYGGDGNDSIYNFNAFGRDNFLDEIHDVIYGGSGDDFVYMTANHGGALGGGDGFDTLVVYEDDLSLGYLTLSGFEALQTNGKQLRLSASQAESFDTIRYGTTPADLANRVELIILGAGPLDLSSELGSQAAHIDTSLATAAITITAGSGSDFIVASRYDDQVHGGLGDDTLWGYYGDDQLYGEDGDDFLVGGGGASGSTGVDFLEGGDGDDYVIAGDESDSVYGGEGDDILYGDEAYGFDYDASYLAGDDVLSGNNGKDTLYGGVGDDTLYGGDGDDFLLSQEGADHAFGGAGADILRDVNSAAAATQLDGGDGDDDIQINTLVTGGTIAGGAGEDRLELWAGNGADVPGGFAYDLSAYTLSGLETLLSFNTVITGRVADFEAFDTISNFFIDPLELRISNGGVLNLADELGASDAHVVASAAGDSITTGKGDDQLDGSAVADTLVGGDGDDSYFGGDGADTIKDINTVAAIVSIDAGAGADSIFIAKVESGTVEGGAGADTLTLTPGDSLSLTDVQVTGVETLYVQTAAVSGAGAAFDAFNTLHYSTGNANLATLINLTITDASVLDLSDELGAQAARITLAAGGGDIKTGSGNDSLFNSAGNDIIRAGGGSDTVYYKQDVTAYTVTPASGAGPFTVKGEGNDTLYGVERLVFKDGEINLLTGVFTPYPQTIYGTAGDDAIDPTHAPPGQHLPTTVGDTLYGQGGNDTLDGGGGGDKLYGGTGNDTYVVDPADSVIENAGEGTDTVQAGFTYTLTANVENLVLTGAAAINGFGNGLNNMLTGNSGANVLTGLGGADTYIIDASDTVVEAAGGGKDTVKIAANYTLGANLENLTLTGTGDFSGAGNGMANVITGNAGANSLTGLDGVDKLYGGDGADLLDGGTGADTLTGGGGDDTYWVDNIKDKVVEAANKGHDIVNSTVSFTLSANVEELQLLGTGDISASGNATANTLLGNSGANLLSGGDGTDTLSGQGGDDELRGGLAADTLTGGGGKDSFVFDTKLGAANVDTITDFKAVDDQIGLAHAIFTNLNAGASLNSGAFWAGVAAHDADDRILYDASTGNLYYDPDGAGGTGPTLFAQLAVGASITAADFYLV